MEFRVTSVELYKTMRRALGDYIRDELGDNLALLGPKKAVLQKVIGSMFGRFVASAMGEPSVDLPEKVQREADAVRSSFGTRQNSTRKYYGWLKGKRGYDSVWELKAGRAGVQAPMNEVERRNNRSSSEGPNASEYSVQIRKAAGGAQSLRVRLQGRGSPRPVLGDRLYRESGTLARALAQSARARIEWRKTGRSANALLTIDFDESKLAADEAYLGLDVFWRRGLKRLAREGAASQILLAQLRRRGLIR